MKKFTKYKIFKNKRGLTAAAAYYTHTHTHVCMSTVRDMPVEYHRGAFAPTPSP